MTSAKSAAKPLRFESAQGPSCRRAGRNAPLLAYGGALAISAKVDFKCVPREVTAIVIPTAIPAAIKPYSKDVPPEVIVAKSFDGLEHGNLALPEAPTHGGRVELEPAAVVTKRSKRAHDGRDRHLAMFPLR